MNPENVTVPAGTLAHGFRELLDSVQFGGRVCTITRYRKPVAVMMSVAEYDRLTQAAGELAGS